MRRAAARRYDGKNHAFASNVKKRIDLKQRMVRRGTETMQHTSRQQTQKTVLFFDSFGTNEKNMVRESPAAAMGIPELLWSRGIARSCDVFPSHFWINEKGCNAEPLVPLLVPLWLQVPCYTWCLWKEAGLVVSCRP